MKGPGPTQYQGSACVDSDDAAEFAEWIKYQEAFQFQDFKACRATFQGQSSTNNLQAEYVESPYMPPSVDNQGRS